MKAWHRPVRRDSMTHCNLCSEHGGGGVIRVHLQASLLVLATHQASQHDCDELRQQAGDMYILP
jgi:hypothetical protein